MRINHVSIKGFRSLGNVSVRISKYSSLIGKNDGGKSSFLHALDILFNPDRTPLASDICKIEGYTDDASIEAVLVECIGHEDLVIDGRIQVRRILRGEKWQWEVIGKTPQREILKKMAAGNLLRGDWNSAQGIPGEIRDITDIMLAELAPKGRVSDVTWATIFSELKDKDLVEWEIGWLLLDKERLTSLVTVVMLEADMRGEEELADGGKSVFSRVGGMLLREATKANSEMITAIEQLNTIIQKVATVDQNGKWVVPELNEFHRVIQEEVSRFDGNVNAQSTLIPPKMPLLEFSVRVEVNDQWVKGIDKMGHGLRRSVIFAMLRAHRRLRTENSQAPRVEASSRVPLYLFLVEEPELYLHPQAESRRMKELQELAALDQTQVVLCTHSAIFVDLREYRGILRFERQDRGVTQVQSWTGASLDSNAEKMLKMVYQFDANRAAMLFAERVILVEGQTEKIMLPLLAKQLGCEVPDVEVIDCGGNQKMTIFQQLLEGFGVKYVAWLDRDFDNADSESSRVACEKVYQAMSHEYGRMIVISNDWEDLTGVPSGKKPYNSWKHFVDDENTISEMCKTKIIAAFAWENHGAEEFSNASLPEA